MNSQSKLQIALVLGIMATTASAFLLAEPKAILMITVFSGFAMGFHFALSKR